MVGDDSSVGWCLWFLLGRAVIDAKMASSEAHWTLLRTTDVILAGQARSSISQPLDREYVHLARTTCRYGHAEGANTGGLKGA